MIEVKNLTKIYKLTGKQKREAKTKDNKKVAVSEVSFCAKEGEIFALLGPNGAGKTTTLRCIATLLEPTVGEITVQGYDSRKQGDKVRSSIAFLTNELKLDPLFSPKYLFRFFGRLHGMSEAEIDERQQALFTYFGITEFQDKKIQELSTGMKQKISIAVSLVHDPEVVIFDEPTNGLDIVTARAVTDYLKVLKEQGKVVVVSTHIMSEAQKLCDRLAMIIGGRSVFEGTLEEVLCQTGAKDLEDAFFAIYRDNVVDEAEQQELKHLEEQMTRHEAMGKGELS
ncbi:MAG: ABC transporter ATP-binding protein [Lachnospira sp.]|nr:ABC transporter ATP-binding protein [Lachnospira sp.]